MEKRILKYLTYKEEYKRDLLKINTTYNLISFLRLFVFLICIMLFYYSYKTVNLYLGVATFITFCFMVFLIKTHDKVSWKRKLKRNIIRINEEEVSYLKQESIPFENGIEYIDYKHIYSFDLDFFGEKSLFHNLNRTATYIGKKKLSSLLLKILTNKEIKSNQEAIKELSSDIKWRHNLLSLAKTIDDNKRKYDGLIFWSKTEQKQGSKSLIPLFYLTPIVFISSVVLLLFLKIPLLITVLSTVFILNLLITLFFLKKIKKEIIGSDKVSEIIKLYSLIISEIEQKNFKSSELINLKAKLISGSTSASKQIKKLSSLFSNLESIQNGMVALLFNGAVLYHIHSLFSLLKWKRNYSKDLCEWLDVIGEFEALSSLANFSYNNPSFVFPDLNNNYDISFKDLGHPLIHKNRVTNDVSFRKNNFMILTGSNMSGKSTFIRSLGINMVLTSIGSCICATKGNIHPLNVIVSMRQSDSLKENESYFFAEVKRLKQIMNKIETQTCFVLLDEILKGTNSDDKQSGTIKVIKRILKKEAIGCIATHDLEVCNTTDEHPNELVNRCFEAEIINDDLFFDYKIKKGVCRNKSATFLMEKMKVI